MATTTEDNFVWSEWNSSGTKWLIKPRADGVNEYTYVHCEFVVNMYLRSLNILSIISSEDEGKGWTLRDMDIDTQVCSTIFSVSSAKEHYAGVSRGCTSYQVHPTPDFL